MRITLVDSARHIANVPRFTHVIVRVIAGTVLIGRDRQTLEDGGGLPVAVSDGIQSLDWDTGPLYMAATPAGTQASIEVVLP